MHATKRRTYAVWFALIASGSAWAAELAPNSVQYTVEEFRALPPPTGPGVLDMDRGKFRQADGPRRDITLTTGTVLKNARVKSATDRAVMIHHSEGLTSVPKEQLPADLLALYPLSSRPIHKDSTAAADGLDAVLRGLWSSKSKDTARGSAMLTARLDEQLDPVFSFTTFDREPEIKTRASFSFKVADRQEMEGVIAAFFRWSEQAVEKKVSAVQRPIGQVSGKELSFTFSEEFGARLAPPYSLSFTPEEVGIMRTLLDEDGNNLLDALADKIRRVKGGFELK